MKLTRRHFAPCVFVACIGATVEFAQGGAVPAQPTGMPVTFIVTGLAFVATWTGLVITILSFAASRRRDHQNLQDRVDGRTKELFDTLNGSKQWKEERDERIREVSRDLLTREYGIEMKMSHISGQTEQLSERVAALSRRVGDIPSRILEDMRAAIAEGVADATKRLTEEQIRSTMVMPDRNRQ